MKLSLLSSISRISLSFLFLAVAKSVLGQNDPNEFQITTVVPGGSATFECWEGGTCCSNPDSWIDFVSSADGEGSIKNRRQTGCGVATNAASVLQCQQSPNGCFVTCTTGKCATCAFDGDAVEQACQPEIPQGATGTIGGDSSTTSGGGAFVAATATPYLLFAGALVAAAMN